MSTDTDYVITIKGKDAALRKAAADYIELLLKPWTPQRDNKKTLVRIDVFRNESNARGLLAPSSLCEDAAKLFPGTDISFKSKNEYGNIQEGHWNEEGVTPKDLNSTVVLKVLQRIQSDVQNLVNQVDWLTPLSEWATSNKAPEKTLKQIKETLQGATAAKIKLKSEQESKERLKLEKETKGLLTLEAGTRWSFHPVLARKNRKIGTLGKPLLWKCIWDSTQLEHNWIPCESSDADGCIAEAIHHECTSVCIGFPILLESSEEQMFLETQLQEVINAESLCVFLHTPGRFRGLGVFIHKYKKAFYALLTPESTDGAHIKPYLKNELRLASILENGGIYQVLDNNAFAGNDRTEPFREEIVPDCLACKEPNVFLATDNGRYHQLEDSPLGRIYCLSQADGTIVWSSEIHFHVCYALVVLGSSSLLVVIRKGRSLFLICMEATTGRERWRKSLDESIGRSFRLAGTEDTALLLSYSEDPYKVEIPKSTNYSYEFQAALLSWVKVSTGEFSQQKTLTKEDRPNPDIALDSSSVYVAGKNWITTFTHEGEDFWTTFLPNGDKCDRCRIVPTGNGTVLISRASAGITCVKGETGTTVWANDDLTWDALVGCNNIAFLTGNSSCTARNIFDGSLLWQKSINKERSHLGSTPVFVNDKFFVINTNESGLKWFDVLSGTEAGELPLSFFSGPLIPLKSGSWVSVQSVSLGCKLAGKQVVSFDLMAAPSRPLTNELSREKQSLLDLKVGTPKGPWPMSRQGEGCAAFLPTVEKSGYKQFIEAWKANENLSPRLARLGLTVADNGNDNAKVLGIIRGHEMVAQAKLWTEPVIGPGKTAPARGRQWRLVMAYGGLELLIKSLSGTKGNGLDEKILENLFGKLSLPTFEPLEPPAIDKSSLKEWIEEEDASDVLDFLKMENGDRRRFDAWLTRQQAVATWGDGVLLAKALRSATAHGALSPTKITEWKLSETLTRLVDNIFRIDEACFEVLGKTL